MKQRHGSYRHFPIFPRLQYIDLLAAIQSEENDKLAIGRSERSVNSSASNECMVSDNLLSDCVKLEDADGISRSSSAMASALALVINAPGKRRIKTIEDEFSCKLKRYLETKNARLTPG